MTDSLPKLLLLRSEAGRSAALWGCDAQPYFGSVFNRLIADGVLTERAPATAWSTCRGCDCDADARDVVEINGRLFAECPVDHLCNTPLGRDHVRSFAIVAAGLAEVIARHSGLSAAPVLIAEAVWYLGGTVSGRAVVLILDPVPANQASIPMLRSRLTEADWTVLLPRGCNLDAHQRLIDAGAWVLLSAEALTGDTFGLDPDIIHPPSDAGTRLALNTAIRSVVLDGRRCDLAEQPFRLLLALAEAARRNEGFVDSRKLEVAVYGDNARPDARDLRDVVRETRDELSSGLSGDMARRVRDLIKNRPPGSYRLLLQPPEVRIRA